MYGKHSTMKYTLFFLAVLFFGAVQAQVPLSALGGQLTNGVAISFVNAADRIPSAVNTGAITLGFTTATALPIGKKITIALPAGYLSAADTTKANTFTTGGAASTATASCALTAGVAGTKVLGIDGADSLICTTATAILAAGAQVLTLIAGAVTTGTVPQAASTFNVATSGDRQLATAAATVALGGELTSGVGISFVVPSDRAPATLSTGAITLGFTTATALPIGQSITIALPAGYLSAADTTKANTFTTGGAASTSKASCALTAGVAGTKVLGIDGADSLICTTATAILAAGAQVLTLIAGSVTTGTPQAASTFNVATSVDRQLATAAATVALGGQLTAGSAIVFSLAADYVPGAAASTGTVKIGFTTATAVPIGGKITIALPRNYFSAADATKENTFTTEGSASSAKAKCTWAAGTVGTAVLGISDAQTLTCVTQDGVLNPGVQVFTLIIGAVTAGASPQAIASYNVATSADRQLAAAPATVALGGQVTAGAAIEFATATDKVPATLNTGVIKIGFTTATAVPHTTGTITIALPAGYFSAADATKENTFTTGGAASTAKAKCVRTAGVAKTAVLGIMGADTLVCTLEAANPLAAGKQVMSLVAGAATTGSPQAAAKYNVATSQDLQLASAPATVTLGSQVTAGAAIEFATAADKVPATLNIGVIKIGFTTVTAVPHTTGTITIALPAGYFSAADATKENTFTTDGAASTAKAKCARTAGTAGTAVLGIASADTLVCTLEAANPLAAGKQVMSLVAGAVTTGSPQAASTYNVATSQDLQLASAPATVALGGQVTDGVSLVFGAPEDRAEGSVNTNVVTIGFTTVTAVPHTTGKITIALPAGYFSAADNTKENTFTTAGAASTAKAKCARTAGVAKTAVLGIMGADTLVCTLEAANPLAAGKQVMSLVAGAVTTGSPQAASTYNVATSQDIQLSAAALVPINYRGGTISNVVEFKFATKSDIMEGTVNTGAITVGFTTSAPLIVSNKITLALPANYFTASDNTKINTFVTTVTTANAKALATATCSYTAGSSAVAVLGVMGGDTLVCTVATATLVAGAQVMTLVPGSVTVGPPQAASSFNLGTSTDIQVPASAATPSTPQKTLYLPKASGAFHGAALLLVALSTLLAFL